MDSKQASNLFFFARHMEGRDGEMDMNGLNTCVLGEMYAIQHFAALGFIDRPGFNEFTKAREIFGIDTKERDRLFGQKYSNVWQRQYITGPEWAAEALRVLAEHGYSSDPATASQVFCEINADDCTYPSCTCKADFGATRAFCARMAEVELREEAETY